MALPRVPYSGKRVRVDGHGTSIYIVVRIDKLEGIATLKLESNPAIVLKRIPFSAIHLVKEDANQAAARIVREATEDQATPFG
jgi:hypothetical protein